jgi:hypothetical protein
LAVQQIFDNFDDIYLGAKASDPTVDNDGDPLNAGDIYWNTTESEIRFYNGTVWERPEYAASQSALAAQSSATAASGSATAASNSASAASTSATNAATSATAAQTAQTAAELAETNAETAETNAEAAQAAAETARIAAELAETNAETAETNAETAETNAAASASAASGSASAAATSATNASNSASAAATSATNAANSATTAASYTPDQTGNAGKFLTTNGTVTSWATVVATPALNDLTDVVITSPATDQVLKYDGTNWVNGTGGGGGGQFFGSAATKAIAYNSNSIAENLTITTGNNGYSAGPITLTAGYAVTVQPGSRWVVL